MDVDKKLIDLLEHSTSNHSIIKNSFDRLINSYNNPNSYKFSINKIDVNLINERNYNFHIEENYTLNNKNNLELLNNKKNSDELLKQNFCDDHCHDKFIKIMKKIKEGKIDINKIDWTANISNNQENQNLFQNLINFYYTQGYNQGKQETSNQVYK